MPIPEQGSSGPEAKELQARLKELGFDPKAADGRFGRSTREAVIAFQKNKGLPAEGIVGPQTTAAL